MRSDKLANIFTQSKKKTFSLSRKKKHFHSVEEKKHFHFVKEKTFSFGQRRRKKFHSVEEKNHFHLIEEIHFHSVLLRACLSIGKLLRKDHVEVAVVWLSDFDKTFWHLLVLPPLVVVFLRLKASGWWWSWQWWWGSVSMFYLAINDSDVRCPAELSN